MRMDNIAKIDKSDFIAVNVRGGSKCRASTGHHHGVFPDNGALDDTGTLRTVAALGGGEFG